MHGMRWDTIKAEVSSFLLRNRVDKYNSGFMRDSVRSCDRAFRHFFVLPRAVKKARVHIRCEWGALGGLSLFVLPRAVKKGSCAYSF